MDLAIISDDLKVIFGGVVRKNQQMARVHII